MKNILYLFSFILLTLPVQAQSLWNEEMDGSFDNWEEVNGTLLPKGWYGTSYTNSSNGNTNKVVITPVTDRHGEEGKACKISQEGDWLAEDSWYIWHLAMATVENPNYGTVNVLNIPEGTEFYYTFWAKADVEGLKMYIGVPQIYDPSHGGENSESWELMPYVELTTEWTQYGFLQTSNYDCTSFSVQLRGNKTFYIDDIVLEVGTELPPLNGQEPEPEPESLWNEGMEGNFDVLEEVNEVLLPKGWYGTTYSDIKVNVEPATDRHGEEGKACKVNCTANPTWHSWHWALRTVGTPGFGTVNVLDIPEDTEFSYTFWAKASEENTRIYIGVEEYYKNEEWNQMPYVNLTTEWRQYGIVQPADTLVGKTFAMHLRQGTQNVGIYIDDIVLVKGDQLPAVMNGIATIYVEDVNEWEENSLSEMQGLILKGNYEAEHFEIIKSALGENQAITFIMIEETALEEIVTDYFVSVNPNCLKYVPEGVTTDLPNYVCGTTAISEIVLTDGKIFDCGEGITTGTAGVSYSRSFANNGEWETIVLPFAPEVFEKFEDCVVEEYVKTENNVITFLQIKELNQWEANTPYILKSGVSSEEAVYTLSNPNAGIEIKTIPVSAEFTGTYKPLEDETIYLLASGGESFNKNNAEAIVAPFRAYYQPGMDAPDRFTVIHEEDDPTGIEAVKAVTAVYSIGDVLFISVTEPQTILIYSIDGRIVRECYVQEGLNQVENLHKGIYIVNNQKVVIK